MSIQPHDTGLREATPRVVVLDEIPPRQELTHYLLRLVAYRSVRRRAVHSKHGTIRWNVTAEHHSLSVTGQAHWTLELLTVQGLIGWRAYLADAGSEFAYPTMRGLDVLHVWDAELFGGSVPAGLVERTGGAST